MLREYAFFKKSRLHCVIKPPLCDQSLTKEKGIFYYGVWYNRSEMKLFRSVIGHEKLDF